MADPQAIIIGGGPAGLTAAYDLLTRTSIRPIVLEQDGILGGISRTVQYKGNRIDIGPHRFFSKCDRVVRRWFELLQGSGTPGSSDDMLVCPRKTRIYHARRFFDYPLRLSPGTIAALGVWRTGRMGLSYLKARLAPVRPERNLEDFLVNRFGRELYRTFFESYTEKVWGVPCRQISPEWGAQRIKGLSITRAVGHALARPLRRLGLGKGKVETSLIEEFFFPKYGAGQMWETCARRVQELGGTIALHQRVERVLIEGSRVVGVAAVDPRTGEQTTYPANLVFSTMPVKDLIEGMGGAPPAAVRDIARGLVYRDLITVDLLFPELLLRDRGDSNQSVPEDNWIYIQEPDVLLGRLQFFNNWGPAMVADPATVWLGLEYFCNENDRLWQMADDALVKFGADELGRLGIADPQRLLDGTVLRMRKTYPAYFGSYSRFDELRQWLDGIENLALLGRNGMHRYNNQDHSMLTAMTAVDNLVAGRPPMQGVWDVNTEREYHEEKAVP